MEEIRLLYPNLDPSLRRNKRIMIQEAKSVLKKVKGVERIMEEFIFNDFMSYKEAFEVGLESFQKVINKMSLKYITVNKMYFKDTYQPKNKKYLFPSIHSVHEVFRFWGALIPRNNDEE